MFIDYLQSLVPVLPEEEADFRAVCRALSTANLPVDLMPSVTFDLWPVFSLQCTEAKAHVGSNSGSRIYIASIGEHDFYFQNTLETKAAGFYEEDADDFGLMYGAELSQMLLLKSESIEKTFSIVGVSGDANVIYMEFYMKNGTQAHVFYVLDTMLSTWKNCFEKYSIPCDVLIDSHKGLGDWFDTTELYSHFQTDAPKHLLPKLYFKGKYISHPAPDGFRLLHNVAESGAFDCVSQLYRTNYID